MALDKRTWANIAAGTVAVIAIVFGVKQCNDKRDASYEANQWHKMVNENTETMNNATGTINDLQLVLKEAAAEVAEKDSLIVDLRDSLIACREEKAKDCVPCKKKPVTTKKPVPAKKPVPTKPVPVVTPVVADQTPDIYVAPDTVIVRNTPKPAQTIIINGDNNGSVNTGTIIVNGDNNDVNNSNGTKKQKNENADLGKVVMIKRVRCR